MKINTTIIENIMDVLQRIVEKGIMTREDFFYGDSYLEREERRVLYNNLFILLLKFCSRILGYANNYNKVKTLLNRGYNYDELAMDLLEIVVSKLDYLLSLSPTAFIPYVTRMVHNRLFDLCKATKNVDVTDSINQELTDDGFTLEDILADIHSLIQDKVEYREYISTYIRSLAEKAEPMCCNADFSIVLYLNVILGYKAERIADELFTRGVRDTYMSAIEEFGYYDVYINSEAVVKETGFTKMIKDPCITSEKLQRKVSQTLNAIKKRFPDEFEHLMELKASYAREVSKSAGNKAKTL
jgi:hypothetical protein